MGAMSMGHWLVVLVIIVLLFGAKKIPELAQGVGKGIKAFKNEMDEVEDMDKKKAQESESVSTEATEPKESEKA